MLMPSSSDKTHNVAASMLMSLATTKQVFAFYISSLSSLCFLRAAGTTATCFGKWTETLHWILVK